MLQALCTLPIGPKVVPFSDYLTYGILNMNPKKELLWGLWVDLKIDRPSGITGAEFQCGQKELNAKVPALHPGPDHTMSRV